MEMVRHWHAGLRQGIPRAHSKALRGQLNAPAGLLRPRSWFHQVSQRATSDPLSAHLGPAQTLLIRPAQRSALPQPTLGRPLTRHPVPLKFRSAAARHSEQVSSDHRSPQRPHVGAASPISGPAQTLVSRPAQRRPDTVTSALALASCCPLVVPEVVPLVVATRPLEEPEVVPPALPDCVPRGLLLTLLLPLRVAARPLTVMLLLPALLLLVLLVVVLLSLSESESAAETVGRSWRIHSARPPCSQGVSWEVRMLCPCGRLHALWPA